MEQVECRGPGDDLLGGITMYISRSVRNGNLLSLPHYHMWAIRTISKSAKAVITERRLHGSEPRPV